MVSELPLTISAQDGLISQDEFFNKKVASKDLSSYLLLYHGDFAYNKSYSNGYPFGTIKRLEKYPQGVVSSLYIAFKPNSRISTDFMAQYYESNNWHKEIYKCAAEGARNHGLLNVPPSDFFATDLNIPINKSEQLKIGRLLNIVDHTITLHEEKKRQLERLKSALLQKIFADKSGYPAVRFKGFDEMWKQSKFGEITQKYKIRNKQGRILKSFSVSNSNGFVPQELQFENGGYALNADKTNSIIVKPNSFAYNPARINVGSIGYYNGDKDILVSSLYEVFTLREGFDSKYMWYWIKSNNFDRWIYRLQEGSVRSYFYYDKFSEIKELLPSLDEQKKIGQLLSKLDSVIYIHDRALLLLNMIKQSLLQKMFI